jgi:uncharacterized membrane protein
VNAALSAYSDAISNVDMASDADLATNLDTVSNRCTSCYAYLSSEHAMHANLDVVADLAEIVQLRSAADHRGTHHGTIHAAIRPNFYMVT